jgi:hypothetical protein
LDNEPIPGVKVYLYNGASASNTPMFSGRTNKDGMVRLPVLSLGTYRVDASLKQHTATTLVSDEIRSLIRLKVIRQSESSNALIDLTNARNDAREYAKQFEDRLAEADLGPRARLRIFEGTVRDPLGTLIPSTEVSVFQSTSKGWVVRVRTRSDPSGYFSSKTLSQGRYVGLFSAGGFRLAMVPFEIDQELSGKLLVKLSLGFSDTSVPQDSSRIATTDNWQLTTDN